MIGRLKEEIQYWGYFQFYQHILKCNADAAINLLERLNEAADAGNCQVCMWSLERHFPEEYGGQKSRKTNVVSENKNENVEVAVKEVDQIRKQI